MRCIVLQRSRAWRLLRCWGPPQCGPDRTVKVARAYIAFGASPVKVALARRTPVADEVFAEKLAEIRLDATRCPETGWVQVIAAGAQLKCIERLEADTPPGQGRKAEHVPYVAGAVDHILAAQQDVPQGLNYAEFNLSHQDWFAIGNDVGETLTSYAEAGHDVHPLVSDTPPPISCNSVTQSIATGVATSGGNSRPSSLKLLTAMADACRDAAEFTLRSPLAETVNVNFRHDCSNACRFRGDERCRSRP